MGAWQNPEKVPLEMLRVDAILREQEQQFMTKLEDIYSNMSESVLQALRRRLPVTRTKFDWDKLAVAKLASDLQRAAAK